MKAEKFKKLLAEATDFQANRFHPLVWINGEPKIGKNVYIGGMSEVNGKGAKVAIGDNCDIASFVSINCADSHKKCIGLAKDVERRDITLVDILHERRRWLRQLFLKIATAIQQVPGCFLIRPRER